MQRIIFLNFLIVTILSCAPAYGQGVRFSKPERLSDNINSDYEEVMPLVSHDGQTLYFSRFYDPGNVGGRDGGADIYASHKGPEDVWEPATNSLVRINNKYHNVLIGLSRSDARMFLMNNYAGNASKRNGVSESTGRGSRWSTPEDLDIPGTASESFHGYYMHPDGKILLISMEAPGTYGEEDLYVSLKDESGTWSTPVNLGSTINSSRFEISPFLSEDGKRLFFASSRPGGQGDADLYVAERLYGTWDVWTQPVNLGRTVNTPYFDAYPSIDREGTLYFASNRDGRLSDIYKSSLSSGSYEKLARSGATSGAEDAFAVGIDTELGPEEIQGIFGMEIPRFIRYDARKEEIIPASRELIWFVVNELQKHPGVGIVVFARGDELEEAGAVRNYFIENGLLPEMIAIKPEPERASRQGQSDIKAIGFAFYK